MKIEVSKVRGFGGSYIPPGDKSITHRAFLLGGLATGKTVVRGALFCADTLHLLQSLNQLGVSVRKENDSVIFNSPGLDGLHEPGRVLNLGNSGTGCRLLAGVLATRPFLSILTGDASLRKRPMDRIASPLRDMGAKIFTRSGGRAPIVIIGGDLRGISYKIPVASAQIKSCLLLAGLGAEGDVIIEEPAPSRDHTERILQSVGISLNVQKNKISMAGGQRPQNTDLRIPGDISSAAFMIAACLLVGNGDLRIQGVGLNPGRTGFLDAIREMRADVTVTTTGTINGEPVGEVTVSPSILRGFRLPKEWVPRMIDELPILALMAGRAEGETVISGAGELRHKETDRISNLAAGLRRLGIPVREMEDGLVIRGPVLFTGAQIPSWGDHRLAMSWAIAGLTAEKPVAIRGAEAVKTSFPSFFSDLKKLSR